MKRTSNYRVIVRHHTGGYKTRNFDYPDNALKTFDMEVDMMRKHISGAVMVRLQARNEVGSWKITHSSCA